MPIFGGSRYEGRPYTPVTLADSTVGRFLHLRIAPPYSTKLEYELLPKQELDLLAYQFSGQARNWWQIAEANGLFWPFDLPAGTKLKIPF